MASTIDTSGIDATKPSATAATTASVRDNFSAIKTQLGNAKTDVEALQAGKLDASAVSAFGLTLIDDADAAAARSTLGALATNGDGSAVTVTATGGTAARSVAQRFGVVLELEDFGADATGTNDVASALEAAYAALPAAGGALRLRRGSYKLATAVSLGGKPFALIGDGTGVTNLSQTHTGTGITITQTSLLHETIIEGIEFTAANPAAPCARALDIAYPAAASFGFRTATVRVCTFTSAPAQFDGGAYSYTNGVRLENCWNAEVRDNLMFGRPYTTLAEMTDGAFIEFLGWCMDTKVHGNRAHYVGTFLKLSGYWEGCSFHSNTGVGVGYGIWNDPSDVDNPVHNGYRGFSLWVDATHMNAVHAAVELDGVKEVYLTNPDFQKYTPSDGVPASTWYGVNGIGLSGLRMFGGYVEGGGAGTTRTGVSITNGTVSSGDNLILGTRFGNCDDHAVYLGVNVTRTLVDDCISVVANLHANNFTDASGMGTNLMRWQRDNKTACHTDHIFAGAAGQPLYQIGNVTNAVNYALEMPAVAGTSPRTDMTGTDANIGREMRLKGVAGFQITTHGGASTAFRVQPKTTPTSWLDITQGDASANPKLSPAGAATHIGVAYESKGGGGHTFFGWTGGSTLLNVLPTPATGASNYFELAPQNMGVSPELRVRGVDTDINMIASPKGSGVFGVSYASAAAGTPGSFTADRVLTLLAGGTVVYIPCRTSTW
ncbi:MAG TPA: hypothetical protein VD995_04635 [Azospirillum sp.]|nr:hypothetical protein [Azospirillum sp.]